MGNLLSKSSSNKTIASLAKIQTSMQTYEKKRSKVKQTQELLLKRTLYTSISLTLMYSLIAYNNKWLFAIFRIPKNTLHFYPQNYYINFIFMWLPVILVPLFYLAASKFIKKFYQWRIQRWDRKILFLRKEKNEILDKVMDTETFNNARQIFEKFDPNRLKVNFGQGAYRNSVNQKRNESKVNSNIFNSTVDSFEKSSKDNSHLEVRQRKNAYKNTTFSAAGDPTRYLPKSVLERNRAKNSFASTTYNRKNSVNSVKSSDSLEATPVIKSQEPQRTGFFSRFGFSRISQPASSEIMSKSHTDLSKSKSVKIKPRSKYLEEAEHLDDSYDIGPIVPKINAEELKLFSKKAGITSLPKLPKKDRELNLNRHKVNRKAVRKTKETSRSRSREGLELERGRCQELVPGSGEIEKLKAEIARLKNEKEEQKYSVKGRIDRSVSDRSRSSRADIIKKNRKELIKKKRQSERNSSYNSLTNLPTSSITPEDISTRSSLADDLCDIITQEQETIVTNDENDNNLSEDQEATCSNNNNNHEVTETMKNSVITIRDKSDSYHNSINLANETVIIKNGNGKNVNFISESNDELDNDIDLGSESHHNKEDSQTSNEMKLVSSDNDTGCGESGEGSKDTI